MDIYTTRLNQVKAWLENGVISIEDLITLWQANGQDAELGAIISAILAADNN